jgi:thiamine transport system substrate-binding protein
VIDRVRLRRVTPALFLLLSALAACAEPAAGDDPDEQRHKVTLVTDESWELPRELRAAFERQTELRLVHRKVGRTPGDLVEALAEHKGRPFGDVVAGIDSSTAPSALATGTLAPYTSPEANKGQQRFSVDKQQRLSAVDLLDVCVNVDETWFAKHDAEPPETLGDLIEPEYRDLLTVPSPQTSAEGTGFLLGTVARYGKDGWPQYWRELKANGVQVVDGMEQVETRYTAASKDGERPIAVGPATLPARLAEADKVDAESTALPDTCHQQVRYAGVLVEASNSQRAGMLLDFLLTQQFQQAVPAAFGTYPVRKGVELPDGWEELAAQPDDAPTLPARTADAGRKRWVAEWREVMGSG